MNDTPRSVNPRYAADTSEPVAVTDLLAGDLIDLQGDRYADPGHGTDGHHCGPHRHEYLFTEVGDDYDRPGTLVKPDTFVLFVRDLPGVYSFPPGHHVQRVHTDDADVPRLTAWNNNGHHWWRPLPCRTLHALFESSAQDNDGTPAVGHDHATAHIAACATCRDTDTRVTLDTNGAATIEPRQPARRPLPPLPDGRTPAVTTTPTVLFDAMIMCMTCGYSPDPDRGLVVHDEKWNEHGHTDSAHMPNWHPETTEWELTDVGTLTAGDVLGTGETVRTVAHADTDIESWPDTEDGQTSVVTDQRTMRVGWPGGSRIIRRVRP